MRYLFLKYRDAFLFLFVTKHGLGVYAISDFSYYIIGVF